MYSYVYIYVYICCLKSQYPCADIQTLNPQTSLNLLKP